MQNVEYIDAGAGTGKTYRLTHDLADLLTGGNQNGHNPGGNQVNPSEVIVTTFTKAAASEIKDRARQVLLEQGKVQEASQLDSAAIGTVHSVCQQFMNKYWYLLGNTPKQEVITDEDRDIYQNDALGTMINSGDYNKQQKAFDKFFLEFRPKKMVDNNFQDNPDFWCELLNKTVNKITYYSIDQRDVTKSCAESCKVVDDIYTEPGITPVGIQTKYAGIISTMLSDWDNFNQTQYIDKGKDTTDEWKKLRQNLEKLPPMPTYYALVTLASSLTKAIAKATWNQSANYDASLRQVESWLRSEYYASIIKDCIKAIFDMVNAWLKKYRQYKQQKGVIDYDDMEMSMLKLLDEKTVRDEIAEYYKLVMVDEFQDCNPVQLRIFQKLSEIVACKPKLPQSSIWVGDPKQAIYGFRGSDTNLINRVAAKFPKVGKTEKGLKHDSLTESRRSREALVDLAYDVFRPLFPDMPTITAHRGTCDDRLQPAIRHWNFAEKSKPAFARAIAKEIKTLKETRMPVEEKAEGDETPRTHDVKWGDIAILCRTRYDVKTLVEQLRIEDVPVSAPETEIFDRAEIQLVLAILNLSEKPENPNLHEVASILHLWKDMTTEEILADRLNHMSGDWQKGKLPDIDVLISHLKGMNLSDKIKTIILELGLYDRVQKWVDSSLRKQNLMTLQNVAERFVGRCTRLDIAPTANNFCAYLQETTIEAVPDRNSDTVKVMTYHGSKGLEWPVVMLFSLDADDMTRQKLLSREFWDVRESAIDGEFSDADHLLPKYLVYCLPDPYSSGCPAVDNVLWPETVTDPVHPILQASKERVKGEMSRLLYVGVTRARDYLYALTNNGDDKGKGMEWPLGLGIFDVFLNAIAPRTDFPRYEPVKPTRGKTKAEIESYEVRMAEYELLREEYDHPVKAPQTYQLRDLPSLTEQTGAQLFQSPSSMPKDPNAPTELTLVKDICARVTVTLEKDADGKVTTHYSKTAFGTCIHNIYAACQATGSKWNDKFRTEYTETARKIIKNFGLSHILTKPEEVVGSLECLYQWLEEQYGAATEIIHECPFNYAIGSDGQIISGEIDLIWMTGEGAVIVDFKNYCYHFEQKVEAQPEDVVSPSHPHYAGHHYTTQLNEYRKILQNAGIHVRETLLYYNLIGCAVLIKS